MDFKICLTQHIVAAINIHFTGAIPHSCSFSAQKYISIYITPNFLTLFELPVQSSSLKKMAHTAQHIYCTSTSSCKRDTMENISFCIKFGWTSQGCYRKHSRDWTFLSQMPLNGGSQWLGDRRAFPAGKRDCWLCADLGWLFLAGHDLIQCHGWNPALCKEPNTKPPPQQGEEGQCITGLMRHDFHSQ